MHLQFPDEPKVLALDTAADAGQVFRFLASARPHALRWREQRPYMLVERVAPVPGTNNVQVCGYLRGSSMSANQLVHITGIGDFQLDKIEAPEDPALPRRAQRGGAMEDGAAAGAGAGSEVLDKPDEKQEALVSENVPDVMANEQNFDEDVPEHPPLEIVRKKRVPKGTSEYQAHWILDSDEVRGVDASVCSRRLSVVCRTRTRRAGRSSIPTRRSTRGATRSRAWTAARRRRRRRRARPPAR